MTDKNIIIEKEIEEKIGYSFKNKTLLKQAFTRKSYSEENIGEENNEVLEFIGDSVLGMIVVKRLSQRYKFINFFTARNRPYICELNEAELSELKINLVQRDSLSKAIEGLGLEKYLRMSKGDVIGNIQNEASVKEDLLEAILGAVAIDSNWNMEKIEAVVKKLIDIDLRLEDTEGEDYRNKLHSTFSGTDLIFSDEPSICEELRFGCSVLLMNNNTKISEKYYGYGNTKEGAQKMATNRAEKHFNRVKNMADMVINAVGEPNYDKAINQIQELYQKKMIPEPKYIFTQRDLKKNGNPEWECRCIIEGICNDTGGYIALSKSTAKKLAAFDALNMIVGKDLKIVFQIEEE